MRGRSRAPAREQLAGDGSSRWSSASGVQQLDTCRDQFDRQRQPVHPRTDLRHGWRVRVGHPKSALIACARVDEQPHRVVLRSDVPRMETGACGTSQWRDDDLVLARRSQRLATGHQHHEPRRSLQASRPRPGQPRVPARSYPAPSSMCLVRRKACTVESSGSPPCSLTPSVCAMVGSTSAGSLSGARSRPNRRHRKAQAVALAAASRQPGLSHASWPGQRHQSHRRTCKQIAHCSDVIVTADQ